MSKWVIPTTGAHADAHAHARGHACARAHTRSTRAHARTRMRTRAFARTRARTRTSTCTSKVPGTIPLGSARRLRRTAACVFPDELESLQSGRPRPACTPARPTARQSNHEQAQPRTNLGGIARFGDDPVCSDPLHTGWVMPLPQEVRQDMDWWPQICTFDAGIALGLWLGRLRPASSDQQRPLREHCPACVVRAARVLLSANSRTRRVSERRTSAVMAGQAAHEERALTPNAVLLWSSHCQSDRRTRQCVCKFLRGEGDRRRRQCIRKYPNRSCHSVYHSTRVRSLRCGVQRFCCHVFVRIAVRVPVCLWRVTYTTPTLGHVVRLPSQRWQDRVLELVRRCVAFVAFCIAPKLMGSVVRNVGSCSDGKVYNTSRGLQGFGRSCGAHRPGVGVIALPTHPCAARRCSS